MIQALLVLVVGFIALGLFKRWLQNSLFADHYSRYGHAVSFITLVLLHRRRAGRGAGPVGGRPIGLERIAWVASGLSVGIGFWLAAVVQTFVSG